MRRCIDTESHHHSFVGDIAALRWAIFKNKRYLWGQKCYCLCDMKILNRILEYDSPIHCLWQWYQELQAYDLDTFHRPAIMMKDVDILNCGPYDKSLVNYFAITTVLCYQGLQTNVAAYNPTILLTLLPQGKINLKNSANGHFHQPVFTTLPC